MIKVLFPFEGHTSSIKTGFVEILRINSHIFKGRSCDVATIRNPPRVGPSNCPPREKSGRMTVESVLVGLEPTSRIITLKTMVETPPESKCSDWIVHMKCLYFSFEKKKHVKKRNQKKEGGCIPFQNVVPPLGQVGNDTFWGIECWKRPIFIGSRASHQQLVKSQTFLLWQLQAPRYATAGT